MSAQTPSFRPFVQHAFGHPLGFCRIKVGNGPKTKKATNMAIFRLGVAYKRAIDKHDLPACLAFMTAGYSISFFIVSKRHDGLYTIVEIASLAFAFSLSGLHAFATRKNLDLLAAVNQCFWTNCAVEQTQNATFEEGNRTNSSQYQIICHSWPNPAKGSLANHHNIDPFSRTHIIFHHYAL
ncbi:hypothetical protein BCR43DRAFT_71119 [Syncephalastrum racemosum]|uniref:Uncharacterized protein n=1 Tax=Syncephalastrum racemosum TaxID=13706 RepID=A0A1X2HWT5_SYNRA|nr:hypothetical protein BCR43DRAFT_71119 [Syncephalastrum racemosum]